MRTALSAGHASASASASASAAAASDSDEASAALAAAVGAGGAGAEGGIRRALSGEMEMGATATRVITRARLAARQ